MLSQSIWWGSIALEVLLLIRGSREKLASRYHAFYAYILFILVQDILLLVVPQQTRSYAIVYWTAEFLSVMFGCVVVFEIYRVGLAAYPGTARMARNVLAFVFAVSLAKGIANAWSDSRWWLQANALGIERILRTVQSVAIVALVALFLLYSIPFRTNLRGILLGYGLFVSVRVVCLTFVSGMVPDFWFHAYSASYVAALGIWIAHLWSYDKVQDSEPATARLETDYQKIAAATRRRLVAARGQLAKAVRP